MKRYVRLADIKLDFPVCFEYEVVWGDMDAFLHVNNVVYFRYFESARMRFFEMTGIDAYRTSVGIGPILGATSCKYIRPVTYPDRLWSAARYQEGSLEEDRFVMDNIVYSEEYEQPVAVGSAEVVFYDYKNLCKASIPEHLRSQIEGH